jgi:S1-C subfamily serine protease
LAVLLAEGPLPAEARLRPLPVGASDALKIGQTVYALGARYGGTGADGTAGGGGGPTMSAGVVSGLQRAIPTPVGTRVYGCVQVDAVVNAANSGGPLVDSNGRLVGLSTAPFTSKNLGRGGGVNFALPSELLVETVPNLIVYGNASARGVRAAAPSS